MSPSLKSRFPVVCLLSIFQSLKKVIKARTSTTPTNSFLALARGDKVLSLAEELFSPGQNCQKALTTKKGISDQAFSLTVMSACAIKRPKALFVWLGWLCFLE